MNNMFSTAFILSDAEIQYSQIDLVELHKQRRDKELDIALSAAQQKDSRSFITWKSDWKETPVFCGIQYSRTAYLFLSNPEEATSSNDLVWISLEAQGLDESTSLFIAPSGKVFRPVGEAKLVWRLEDYQKVHS